VGERVLGPFELAILLALLRLGTKATAGAAAHEIELAAERDVSRGAIYRSLERMREKGLVDWQFRSGTVERGGYPARHLRVTPAGLAAVRSAYAVVDRLSHGLGGILSGGATP